MGTANSGSARSRDSTPTNTTGELSAKQMGMASRARRSIALQTGLRILSALQAAFPAPEMGGGVVVILEIGGAVGADVFVMGGAEGAPLQTWPNVPVVGRPHTLQLKTLHKFTTQVLIEGHEGR